MVQCEMCGREVPLVDAEHLCPTCRYQLDNRIRHPRDSVEPFSMEGRKCFLTRPCPKCMTTLVDVDFDDDGPIYADLVSGPWHAGEWQVHSPERCAVFQSKRKRTV